MNTDLLIRNDLFFLQSQTRLDVELAQINCE